MNADTVAIVGELSKQADEVINGINPKLTSVREAVESMDGDTQCALSRIDNKLDEICGVLEDIRDLLRQKKQTADFQLAGARIQGKKVRS